MTGAQGKSDDDEDWWPLDRPNAVELLQTVVNRYEARLKPPWRSPLHADDGMLSVSLPIKVWQVILDSALTIHTDDGMLSVSLPIKFWRFILDSALKGMHKGQRHRPPLTRGDKARREVVAAFGRKRKIELMADARKRNKELLAKRKIPEEGEITTTEDCEEQAAKDAQELAQERYSIKLKISTIRKWMSRSPDIPDI
jgi:hypothetical protein